MNKLLFIVFISGLFLSGCNDTQEYTHQCKIHVRVRDVKTGEIHKATITTPSNIEGDYELVTN